MELQATIANIRKQQLEVAAISYDSPAILKSFADRNHITFPLLSDPGSETIRAYGLLVEGVPQFTPDGLKDRFLPGGEFYGVPYPGTFILNTNNVVVAKYFDEDYRERYTASDILIRQFGTESGGQKSTVETKHLALALSSSLASVKVGERIALTIDVDLKPQMHVYAPGVAGYIPIGWSLEESTAYKSEAVNYPPAKKLHLKAINETVPVFQGKFRLVREIVAGQGKPGTDVVIHGTLRYQACDERICYVPQTVPVSWTLKYEALDTQRAPAELRRKSAGQ